MNSESKDPEEYFKLVEPDDVLRREFVLKMRMAISPRTNAKSVILISSCSKINRSRLRELLLQLVAPGGLKLLDKQVSVLHTERGYCTVPEVVRLVYIVVVEPKLDVLSLIRDRKLVMLTNEPVVWDLARPDCVSAPQFRYLVESSETQDSKDQDIEDMLLRFDLQGQFPGISKYTGPKIEVLKKYIMSIDDS
jgi:hypothetical protein